MKHPKFKVPESPLQDDESVYPLIPFEPSRLKPKEILEREVTEVRTDLGTYGMGGYGFFGLRLEQEWLYIALSDADEWLMLNGRRVSDPDYEEQGRPKPFIVDWLPWIDDAFVPSVVGKKITYCEVESEHLRIELDSTVLETRDLEYGKPFFQWLTAAGVTEPFDLRSLVFLCPSSNLWI